MYNKKGDALKLFLAEFRNGSSVTWISDKEYYKTKIYSFYLGDLKKIISSLTKDGLLRLMTPEEIFSKDNKITDLKEECKKRGLKVSGKKDELVARIMEADPDLRKNLEKQNDQLICTTTGQIAVNEFYERMKQQEKDLQTLVFALFEEKRYKDAANAVEQIRNRRVFPDWWMDDFTSQLSLDVEEKEVEMIWKETPKALSGLKKAFLDKARFWISWDMLWGTNHIREFEKEPTNVDGLSIGQVMQALMIYATGKRQLADLQKTRVFKGVRIVGLAKDTVLCPECQKLTNKVYDLKKAPVIPNEKCQNPAPCPLSYIADMEGPKKKLFGLFE